MPSQRMRGWPTELVIWNVAIRVGGETVHHQVDLHLADLRDVVVLLLDARLDPRDRVRALLVLRRLQLLLHLADERGVLVKQYAVLGADDGADLLQVVLHVVEDAGERLAVLHPTVEFAEHLIRVVNGRDRLVVPRVHHARPGVGAVGDHDAELQRAEARAGRGILLQVVPDLLVDGEALRPSRRGVRPALDVARVQLDAGEKAAHAAHVGVAVAANPVADAVQEERAVLERLQRLDALLERELVARLVRPEGVGEDAVGREHDDEALLARRLICEPQAGEVQDEWDGSGAEAEVAQEVAAGGGVTHGMGFHWCRGRPAFALFTEIM
jgi:hypothetical protein